ncbi:hypothetical protein CL656_05595 [bacterium]|nr:hypothetical protein [bacterium]
MFEYIIILTLLELCAQFLLKLGLNNKVLITLGMIFYAIVGYIYYLGLKKNKFANMSIAWHVVMAVVTLLIGIFYFKEEYNKKELLGLILGILSILLLHSSHH